MSSKLVRVKNPATGTESTVGRQFAKNSGLQIIDKPAADAHGRALPAKRSTTRQASKQQEDQSSTGTKKEGGSK